MRIFVWGAGFAARELLESELAGTEITAFIDRSKKQMNGYIVCSPDEYSGLV